MTDESNDVVAIATLSDWLRRLAPVFQQGSYGSWKTWKVMEFKHFSVQAWKVLEFHCGSWKVMENYSVCGT